MARLTIDDIERLLPAVLAQYRREGRSPTGTAIARTVAELREEDERDRPCSSATEDPYR